MVFGRELSPAELAVINLNRRQEFGSVSVVAPVVGSDDWERLYFLVEDHGQLMAFGRLHQTIAADLAGVRHQILGIASIVAIEKGQATDVS